MASKKKDGDEHKPPPLIGRIGTSLKMGIVGLPNVGKSTFFNVLTKSQAAAENFPFCTINPNESRVPVPDERFDFLVDFHKPASKVPAFLNVVDIAGLVKGASQGQGLGNAFLSNIRGVDGLFHVVRAFESEDVTHVEGDIDPIRDLDIISEELRLKDADYVIKEHGNLEKLVVRGNDKKQKPVFECMTKIKDMVCEAKRPVRFGEWNEKELEVLNEHLLITSKPTTYLVNLSENDYIHKKNKWLMKIKKWIDTNDPGATMIPFSADFELKWINMSNEEQKTYSAANQGVVSSLPKIITNGYKALQLQYFFTAGKDEVKAWTIQKGNKAPQAAGKIHTDMEKGFIMAEVMSFLDFKQEGSETACRAAGKYRQKGKEYVVEDGDIMFIKFNAGAGLQAKKK